MLTNMSQVPSSDVYKVYAGPTRFALEKVGESGDWDQAKKIARSRPNNEVWVELHRDGKYKMHVFVRRNGRELV